MLQMVEWPLKHDSSHQTTSCIWIARREYAVNRRRKHQGHVSEIQVESQSQSSLHAMKCICDNSQILKTAQVKAVENLVTHLRQNINAGTAFEDHQIFVIPSTLNSEARAGYPLFVHPT
jgi:hypothetical protein